MKILIATDDCLTIASDFDKANSFRLLKIINGAIKEDSFLTPSIKSTNKYPFGLKELGEINPADKNGIEQSDRVIVLASLFSKKTEKTLLKTKYEVFYTSEVNIINALNVYIKEMVAMESDYCCQP
jgi:hypothetical protein